MATTTSNERASACPTPPRKVGKVQSPAQSARLQKKVQLQNLNERLAAYIDRVRHLEAENNRLNLQVRATSEAVEREVSLVGSCYDKELTELGGILNEEAKAKARIQLDATRLRDELEQLRARYEKIKDQHVRAEAQLRQLETRNNELNALVPQLRSDLVRAKEEAQNAAADRDQLAKHVSELRQQVDALSLALADMASRNTTLAEDMKFKQMMFEREMTEFKSTKQVEIGELSGRLHEQYQSAVQELRGHYEEQLELNREDVEGLFRNKVQDLENQIRSQRSAASSACEQLVQANKRIGCLNSRLTDTEAANSELKLTISESEKCLEAERSSHADVLASSRAEIAHLRDQLNDYQESPTTFDMELATYGKLLGGEESRLNMTPAMAVTPYRRTSAGGIKRRRLMFDDSSPSDFKATCTYKGQVEIAEIDAQGKFIRLRNRGEEELPLAGWKMVHKADGEEMVYVFHRSMKIHPGDLTVWSPGTGVCHKPPSTLVMKNKAWIVADRMSTLLLNSDGEQMAKRDCIISPTLRRQTQQAHPDDRCTVM